MYIFFINRDNVMISRFVCPYSFIHSFIHLFHRNLLHVYYLLGIILDTENTNINSLSIREF